MNYMSFLDKTSLMMLTLPDSSDPSLVRCHHGDLSPTNAVYASSVEANPSSKATPTLSFLNTSDCIKHSTPSWPLISLWTEAYQPQICPLLPACAVRIAHQHMVSCAAYREQPVGSSHDHSWPSALLSDSKHRVSDLSPLPYPACITSPYPQAPFKCLAWPKSFI